MRLVPAVVIGALVLGGCASTHHDASTPTVDVSVTSCGQGWQTSAAGPQHLVLHNTDSRAGEAQIVAPDTGAVYADIEPLGPATTTTLDLALGPGHYAVRCLMEDEAAVTGRPITLTGTFHGGTPGVVPVTQADLIAPTQQYEQYVKDRLPALSTDVAALGKDLDRRAAAQRDWLTAHLAYERLGAAYDAFGELDGAINGLPDGLANGVQDKDFTGFHRIEYGLWHGESAASLRPHVAALAADLTALRTQFATAQIDPLTLTIRAHEITENALQFSLTSADDFGSHSDLATVGANLEGTSAVLDILGHLVPNRVAIHAALTRSEQSVQDTHLSDTSEREKLDASISELAELLAPVASQLEPRRTS